MDKWGGAGSNHREEYVTYRTSCRSNGDYTIKCKHVYKKSKGKNKRKITENFKYHSNFWRIKENDVSIADRMLKDIDNSLKKYWIHKN